MFHAEDINLTPHVACQQDDPMGLNAMAEDAMFGRLVSLGVSPQLSGLLVNVCANRKGKRYPDGEMCLLDKRSALVVVNDLERGLRESSIRMEPGEAGIRLILWALWKLFGPEMGESIGSAYMEELANHAVAAADLAMVQNALRYVDGGPSNEQNSFIVPASAFSGSGDAQQVWDGVLLVTPDRMVHLEWPYVQPQAIGSPIPPFTVFLTDIEHCKFRLTEDIPARAGSSALTFDSTPAGHAPYMILRVPSGRLNFLLPYKPLEGPQSQFVRTKIMALINHVSMAIS